MSTKLDSSFGVDMPVALCLGSHGLQHGMNSKSEHDSKLALHDPHFSLDKAFSTISPHPGGLCNSIPLCHSAPFSPSHSETLQYFGMHYADASVVLPNLMVPLCAKNEVPKLASPMLHGGAHRCTLRIESTPKGPAKRMPEYKRISE